MTTRAYLGLGSNLASVHLDTYLQIIKYDATNLEETITTDLVKVLRNDVPRPSAVMEAQPA